MIAADTNVIVRLLLEDDPVQAQRARQLLESALSEGERCLVSDVVLCELAWVLRSAYAVPRPQLIQAMQVLLSHEALEFDDRQRLNQALQRFLHGKGDFSDYLCALHAESRGARTMFTFDRALRGTAGITVL